MLPSYFGYGGVMEKYYMAAFHLVEGIGSATLVKLVNFFGSAQNAWIADRNCLISSRLLSETVCNNLISHREKIDVHKLAEQWEKRNIKICTLDEDEYPILLRSIFNPPAIIYYRGVLPSNENIIAIVGARRATAYGKNVAGMLASGLAERGFWVVSGGARGIDTAAHLGALNKGKTIAVLGCGVDIIYPPENKKLFDSIAEAGAVVSEYPPGTPVHAAHFPARNRIISGFSKGTIIVEAAEKSGALITADFALEQGRDVFAVPGSIFSSSSKGTNNLIKQGAKLVDSIDDIAEEYGVNRNSSEEKKEMELSQEELTIYSILTCDTPLGIDEIVIKTKLSSSKVALILLHLELRGLITGHGQRYVRAAREGIN